jgi:predicted RNA-binding Zn-ribbon protein involved in translation (DUF1610 family)
MKKKLKSLAENNDHAINNCNQAFSNSPQLNEVACPKCGKNYMIRHQ